MPDDMERYREVRQSATTLDGNYGEARSEYEGTLETNMEGVMTEDGEFTSTTREILNGDATF